MTKVTGICYLSFVYFNETKDFKQLTVYQPTVSTGGNFKLESADFGAPIETIHCRWARFLNLNIYYNNINVGHCGKV